MDADLETTFELDRALREFQTINKIEGLSEEDKTRMKESYLRTRFEPRMQELLKEKLAEDARRRERRSRFRTRRTATPTS